MKLIKRHKHKWEQTMVSGRWYCKLCGAIKASEANTEAKQVKQSGRY